MIAYKKRPSDAAAIKAWDFFVKYYGEPQSMMFVAACCRPAFWSANVNGRFEVATVSEVKKGIRLDTGKK
jgi:hypothetical protein